MVWQPYTEFKGWSLFRDLTIFSSLYRKASQFSHLTRYVPNSSSKTPEGQRLLNKLSDLDVQRSELRNDIVKSGTHNARNVGTNARHSPGQLGCCQMRTDEIVLGSYLSV